MFALNGVTMASWMARVPHLRDVLDLTPSDLSRLLMALAVGSVAALALSGFVVSRFGAARIAAVGSVSAGVALIVLGYAAEVLNLAGAVGGAFVILGFSSGSWVVAVNVEGAAVEQLLNRSIMARFHAAFSLGTVAGAGLGALATAYDISFVVHLTVVGLLTTVTGVTATRHFLPRITEVGAEDTAIRAKSVWSAWREPRTLVIGLMVMCFALIEGIANDWLALGIVEGYDVDNTVGSVAYAMFVTAMTVGRTVGPALIDRYERVPVLWVGGTMAAAGVLLVVFGGSPIIAGVGIVVWGLGVSLGFPLGMSAAADDPERAAARVSVVSAIGYTAFLAGPPVIGWLGDNEGVLRALLVAAAAAVVGVLSAPAARRREPVSAPVSSMP